MAEFSLLHTNWLSFYQPFILWTSLDPEISGFLLSTLLSQLFRNFYLVFCFTINFTISTFPWPLFSLLLAKYLTRFLSDLSNCTTGCLFGMVQYSLGNVPTPVVLGSVLWQTPRCCCDLAHRDHGPQYRCRSIGSVRVPLPALVQVTRWSLCVFFWEESVCE